MDWQTASRLPWGILLLFGGGLSLASAMDTTGVTRFIGEQFQALRGLPLVVMVAAIAGVVIFLTELTSNTAVTTTLMPVLAGAAVGLGVDPAYLLVPAALAASCAFMLPVATPPNAIVFGSGYVSLPQMPRGPPAQPHRHRPRLGRGACTRTVRGDDPAVNARVIDTGNRSLMVAAR